MSVLTNFLKLFKYDNTDKANNVNFNITEALNNNWDKIETNAAAVEAELEQITEQGSPTWLYEGDLFNIKGANSKNYFSVTDKITANLPSQFIGKNGAFGVIYTPFFSEYAILEAIGYSGNIAGIKAYCIYNTTDKIKSLNWTQEADTNKIDILCTANTGFTITSQFNYQINNIVYYNINVKKTDNTDFTVGTNVIGTVPNGKILQDTSISAIGHSGAGWDKRVSGVNGTSRNIVVLAHDAGTKSVLLSWEVTL